MGCPSLTLTGAGCGICAWTSNAKAKRKNDATEVSCFVIVLMGAIEGVCRLALGGVFRKRKRRAQPS
jgi:hypothetical protein